GAGGACWGGWGPRAVWLRRREGWWLRLGPGGWGGGGAGGGRRWGALPGGRVAHGPPGRSRSDASKVSRHLAGEVNSAEAARYCLASRGQFLISRRCREALRQASLRNCLRSRLYHAAVVPSGADTTALSSLDSTNQAASWYARASCGRWNSRGFRNWCNVPAAAFVVRFTLLVGVVLVLTLSGVLRRAGGKSSRSADPRASVNSWRSSRRPAIFVPRSRWRCSGPDSTSSIASSRSVAVEYCIDSRDCNCRSALSAGRRPPRLNGECSSATMTRLRMREDACQYSA